MFYRVEQFIRAMNAKLTEEDKLFIKCYLNEEEQRLFCQLQLYEQNHCLSVARGLKAEYEDEMLIRLGLLHDIGKSAYPLNPIKKSIMVLLNKITGGYIRRLKGFNIVKGHYDHAQISYEYLKQLGNYDEFFLQVVREHHEKNINHIKKNKWLLALQKYDDLY